MSQLRSPFRVEHQLCLSKESSHMRPLLARPESQNSHCHPNPLLFLCLALHSFLQGSMLLPQDLLQRVFLLQSQRADSKAVCLHSMGQGSISGQCLLNSLSSRMQNFLPLNTEHFQVPKFRLLQRAPLPGLYLVWRGWALCGVVRALFSLFPDLATSIFVCRKRCLVR